MTPKLNRNDCDSFYALMEAGEPQTVAQVAKSQQFTSINLAAQSLRRLVIHGLAVKITPPHRGFAHGSAPSTWQLVPGAVFPGVAPRVVRPEIVDPIETPRQSHKRGTLPGWVAERTGLAGLVAQVSK